MSELMKRPIAKQKVQTEIRSCVGRKSKLCADDLGNLVYLKMVVKETLRLHPPAPLLLPHQSIHQCRIGGDNGYDIRTETRALVNVWAIGRDPKIWENPNEFFPERFEGNEIDSRGTHFELLPFGAGRRICPGINLGIGMVEFALANLLYFFDWEFPSGMKIEDLSMEENFGIKHPFILYQSDIVIWINITLPILWYKDLVPRYHPFFFRLHMLFLNSLDFST